MTALTEGAIVTWRESRDVLMTGRVLTVDGPTTTVQPMWQEGPGPHQAMHSGDPWQRPTADMSVRVEYTIQVRSHEDHEDTTITVDPDHVPILRHYLSQLPQARLMVRMAEGRPSQHGEEGLPPNEWWDTFDIL